MVYYSFAMPPNGMLIPVMAGLTLSSMALMQVHHGSKVHDSIAEAELAFSARCEAVGIRKSFLENFHPRGIFFSPQPAFAADDLAKQPEEPLPPASVITWAPAVVDVSYAGDLGYTTGPLKIASADGKGSPRYGQYFSVWTRDHEGKSWKVILDFGTRTKSSQVDPRTVKYRVAAPIEASSTKPGASPNEINDMEAQFAQTCKSGSVELALTTFAAEEIRAHRDGLDPILGRVNAIGYFKRFAQLNQWTPMGTGISKSGDMGYSYGKYALEEDGKPVNGYFARVWKRDRAGAWKLVADIANVAK